MGYSGEQTVRSLAISAPGRRGSAMMKLQRELETYKAKLEELLEHEGEFVLIRGGKVIGTYVRRQEAFEAGVERFGRNPFLVKKLQEVERPVFLRHDVLKKRCQS